MKNKQNIFDGAKTVAIYGTEPYIENIYNFFKDIGKKVLYLIDNNTSGKKFAGMSIVDINEIGRFEEPDIFIIGNGKSDIVIKEKLKKNLINKGIDEHKIFTSYNMWKYNTVNRFQDIKPAFTAFKNVIIEIAGTCNAKCPYCAVNSSRFTGDNRVKKYINPEDFKNAIDTLLNKNIIDKTSVIHLYNWGEPLMHPNINDILDILHKKKVFFALSSNASIMPGIKKEYFAYLDKIKISMSGFTQESYSKIHGFKLDKILKNIDRLIDMVGDKNKIEIFFYAYQFNLKELEPAKEYFSRKGIQLTQRIAFFNDYARFLSYAKGTMDIDELKKVSKELLLYYVDDFIKLNKNYKCSFIENQIVIDENLNYATCCILPKNHHGYKIGNINNLSKEQLIKMKSSQPVCKECYDAGITYWINNVLEYNDFIINGIFLR